MRSYRPGHHIRLLLAAALVLAAAPASAEPARYELDPEHTVIAFLVGHIDYARVLGRFREVAGEFTFDEETRELSDVRIVVTTDSVYTGHRERDEHLRSADFLDAGTFPEMVFTAASGTPTGERSFRVDGTLTLLGRSQPLALDLVWNKSARYPIGLLFKPYVMGVSGRGSFRRSDFGMSYGLDNGLVGDTVELIVEFEARRQ